MKILSFDLDDTLYDELSYVRSGFEAVANFMEKEWAIPNREALRLMFKKLPMGRGKIFDYTLEYFQCYSREKVLKCISTYRLHQPKIRLYPDAEECLKRFRKTSIYIVTDGNKIVQNNKIKALGLNKFIRYSFITHRYGLHNAKPSPYCFNKICALEKSRPENVVYVGDNPNKDFIEITRFGFKSIRLLRGPHKDTKFDDNYNASIDISSLSEITRELIDSL